MLTSPEIGELAKALAAAQAKLENVEKGADNPFFKSKYADLASVLDEVLPKLAEQKLAVVQAPSRGADGLVILTTRLLHESGQWLESESSATAKDNGPQAYGSVVTYLRRYALQAICGVTGADDDGEAATHHEAPTAQKPAAAPAPAAPKPAEIWTPADAGSEIDEAKSIKDVAFLLAKIGKAAFEPATKEHLVKAGNERIALIQKGAPK